jgi:hypothetical protein
MGGFPRAAEPKLAQEPKAFDELLTRVRDNTTRQGPPPDEGEADAMARKKSRGPGRTAKRTGVGDMKPRKNPKGGASGVPGGPKLPAGGVAGATGLLAGGLPGIRTPSDTAI